MTGYDIIPFWVMRMMFSGIEHTGRVPFDTVLIHGLVRDAQGRKMSKSLGNGIDPLEVIDKYGADALRFTLATNNSPGNDMRFSDQKVEASRNFANKIWNASRFVLMNLDENEPAPHLPDHPALEDKWILSQYNDLVKSVTDSLDSYELGIAVQKLYDFIWDVFCDWYIELTKIRLQAGGEAAQTAKAVLVYVLSNTLKLLHPFMPFITEEIWQSLPHEGESIMISAFPEYDEALSFPQDEAEFSRIMAAIRAVRNRRAEMNVPPSKKAQLLIATSYGDTFREGATYFTRLAFASDVKVAPSFDSDGCVSVVTADATIYIPLDELVDTEKEKARLQKDKKNTESELARIQGKLSNQGFLSKAPEAVVNAEKEKLQKLTEKLSMIESELQKL